jgi:hypothetical protein
MAAVTITPWGRLFGIEPVEVLTNYNPGSTPTTYNLSLAAYVPVGTRAVQLSMQGTATVDTFVAFRKTSGSVDVAKGSIQNAAGQGAVTGLVELDANYTCDLYFATSNPSSVYVTLSAGAIP